LLCFQSSQTAFQEQHINGPDLGDDELFSALNDDMPEGIEGMQDFNDIFSWPETGAGGNQSPTGSPRRGDSPSQPGSPSCGVGGTSDQHSPFPCNGSSRVSIICKNIFRRYMQRTVDIMCGKCGILHAVRLILMSLRWVMQVVAIK